MPVDERVQNFTQLATEPTTNDSLVMVNRSTNEGQTIDYNLLADKILDKLTSKTYSGLGTSAKAVIGAINELGDNTKRLKAVKSVPQNADLNEYVTPGEYYCNSNATAGTIVNSPVSMAFRLTVESSTSPTQTQNIKQTLVCYHPVETTYERKTSDGGATWGIWSCDPYYFRTMETTSQGNAGGILNQNGAYIIVVTHPTDNYAYYCGLVFRRKDGAPVEIASKGNLITWAAANTGGTIAFHYNGAAVAGLIVSVYRFIFPDNY